MTARPTRICILSDTHLSPVYGFFYENFRVVAEAVADLAPDLVLHAGDLCVDGAGSEADLAFAAACLRRIAPPLHCLPGNHDIGDSPVRDDIAQPVDATRVARYARHFGDGYWRLDVAGWVLIGLDCQVLGAGVEKEARQWAWLEACLAETGGRPVGLVLHKPLFLAERGPADNPVLAVEAAAAARLEALFGTVDWRFVMSGHLHQYWRRTVDGIDHVWAPSTAFMSSQLKGPSDPRLGFLMLTLDARTHEVTLIRPPGLEERDMDTIKEHGRYAWLRDMPPAPPRAPEIAEIRAFLEQMG